MAQPPVAREGSDDGAGRSRSRFRRLSGLDRSAGTPVQTLPGQPWRVWTVPNAIGGARLALIPVFLVLSLGSDEGTDALPAAIFAGIAWADYLDGIAARVTGQYSRFGALLDPVVDRLLIISGVVACWHHELLPRPLLAILVARELLMLVAGQWAQRRGVELHINWWGRLAVWPVMSAIFFGLVGLDEAGAALLALGVAMAIVATVQYGRDAVRQLRAGPSTSA